MLLQAQLNPQPLHDPDSETINTFVVVNDLRAKTRKYIYIFNNLLINFLINKDILFFSLR